LKKTKRRTHGGRRRTEEPMGIERTRRGKEPTEEHEEEPKHEDERNPRKKNHEKQSRRTDQVNTRNQVLNT